jgi:hypothetical protein
MSYGSALVGEAEVQRWAASDAAALIAQVQRVSGCGFFVVRSVCPTAGE